MLLTRDEQKAVDSAFYELRKMNSETRISTIATQMDAKRREQRQAPTSTRHKYTRSVERNALKEEARDERAYKMYRAMSPRYSTKARIQPDIVESCYAFKKRLPLAVQRQFEREYNETPYGAEQALLDKYRRMYNIR